MPLKLGAFNLERLKLENLYNTYLGLNAREQNIALIALALVLILIILLPVAVAAGKIGQLRKDITRGRTQLTEVMQEIDNYNQIKGRLKQMESVFKGGFDTALSSSMEALATQAGIADRIDSLKEQPPVSSEAFEESGVNARLKRVSLEQVINFLSSVEQHPEKLFRLKSLEIKPRYGNKQELDVSMEISTYRLLETLGGE